MDFVVQIPVRKNSVRVKDKNIRPFADTTLVEIAIKKALRIFSKEQIYLNTNCDASISIAKKYGVEVYFRSDHLCQDEITLDTFTYNFMLDVNTDCVVLINTVTPLLQTNNLIDMMEIMKSDAEISSIISGNKLRLHAFKEGVPINFDIAGPIPQTQNISSIDICNWGFGIWRRHPFIKSYETSRSSVFNKKFVLFDTPLSDSLKISTQADFIEAERRYRQQITIANL